MHLGWPATGIWVQDLNDSSFSDNPVQENLLGKPRNHIDSGTELSADEDFDILNVFSRRRSLVMVPLRLVLEKYLSSSCMWTS